MATKSPVAGSRPPHAGSELARERVGGQLAQRVVVMTASSGGIKALGRVLSGLPEYLPAAIIIVQHRKPDRKGHFRDVLQRTSNMPVVLAEEGDPIVDGVVYIAHPDSHLTISPDVRFRYRDGTRIRFLRSSANPLLESAADVCGDHVVAVVLTGYGQDATDGVQAVKAHGGIVIAQDPEAAEQASMPMAALRSGAVDHMLPLETTAQKIVALVSGTRVAKRYGDVVG